MSRLNIINGYREEVVLTARILGTYSRFLSLLQDHLFPFLKNPITSDNISEYLTVMQAWNATMEELKTFSSMILIINDISKKLWHLKKEWVMELGENQDLILYPHKMAEKISTIPNTLKTEMQQRLITAQLRKVRMEIYTSVVALLTQLEKYPLEQREWLTPYSCL